MCDLPLCCCVFCQRLSGVCSGTGSQGAGVPSWATRTKRSSWDTLKGLRTLQGPTTRWPYRSTAAWVRSNCCDDLRSSPSGTSGNIGCQLGCQPINAVCRCGANGIGLACCRRVVYYAVAGPVHPVVQSLQDHIEVLAPRRNSMYSHNQPADIAAWDVRCVNVEIHVLALEDSVV